MLYSYLFVSNLLSDGPYISAISFWMQGLFYYIYLLYCLGSYRDARELCFYCKFEMSQGLVHCLLGFFMTETFCWGFLVAVGSIFVCTMLVRQMHKEEREEERLKKMERDQYSGKGYKKEKVDDVSEPSITKQSNSDNGNDGAYL